jgi:hypothetical protein
LLPAQFLDDVRVAAQERGERMRSLSAISAGLTPGDPTL